MFYVINVKTGRIVKETASRVVAWSIYRKLNKVNLSVCRLTDGGWVELNPPGTSIELTLAEMADSGR